MLIDNIELIVSSIVEEKEEEHKEKGMKENENENYKTERLRLWEEKVEKDFENLKAPSWV